MSWIEQLWKTYEANQAEVGRFVEDGPTPLLPICHSTQQAQVEIAIDGSGHFIRASVVAPDDARTIIPSTEQSSSRAGSKPVNHPLCDKLQYVAGDFVLYGGQVTSGFDKTPDEPYQMYLRDLTKWCESSFGHPKVAAILQYVKRKTVVADLVGSGVLHVDGNGQLLETWDREKGEPPGIFALMKNRPQWDAFVRWTVEVPGVPQAHVWTDASLYDSWIQYYVAQQEKVDVCYVTGRDAKVATLHPAKLRHDGDAAKIISGNDTSGFTFRGRFTELSQAVGVSFEVTQKAHNALRWLIRKQGTATGEFVVVAWDVTGAKIPDLLADSTALLGIPVTIPREPQATSSTGEEFARRLRQRMLGYGTELGDTSRIVVMGLDSASPGRMSIIFYRELTGSEFLSRVEGWHVACSWRHTYRSRFRQTGSGAEAVEFIGAPAPSDIAEAAYGARVDEKLRKRTIERLLPCIVDGQRIPADLVDSVVRRASNRSGLERPEWSKALTIACALYRKLHEKEEYQLALEEGRRSRDYLYGRLLALADSLEDWALNEAGENRQTNAARLMQRFAERPYSTWRTLELALAPYKARLGVKGRRRLNQISEVMAMFDPDDFTSDRKLSGEFLLGYHCQRSALWNRHDEQSAGNGVLENEDHNREGMG